MLFNADQVLTSGRQQYRVPTVEESARLLTLGNGVTLNDHLENNLVTQKRNNRYGNIVPYDELNPHHHQLTKSNRNNSNCCCPEQQ